VIAGVLAHLAWMRKGGFEAPNRRQDRPAAGQRAQGLSIVLSFLLQFLLALLAARFLHRDFLSLIFQTMAIHFGLFLDEAPGYKNRIPAVFAERLVAIAIAFMAFMLLWIALMGYAIVARQEPRWIPSIIYNALNLCICGFLGFATLQIRTGSRRELVVSEAGLFLDGLDVLPLFSPSARPLARFFAGHVGAGPLVCREAQKLVSGKICLKDSCKASGCAEYRYLYNRVLEVRRVFAALRIGRISSPEHRQSVLEEGWRFVPDPSVRVLSMAGPGPETEQKR
jgi:hypothetical protein